MTRLIMVVGITVLMGLYMVRKESTKTAYVDGCETLYYEIYEGLSLKNPGKEVFKKDCQDRAKKAGY